MRLERKTVAVGLSGGVDSAVAAWRLQQEGCRVIGLTMSLWDGAEILPEGVRPGCFGPGEAQRLAATRATAERLGIELHVIPLAEEFRRTVLANFRAEYLAGRTPNPCVWCNHQMKFGMLLEAARGRGIDFDAFATGHYARTKWDEASGRWQLLRGRDRGKDQSYFLARLSQEQLAMALFPLGELTKAEARATARELGWADLAERDESQDFLVEGHYGDLVGAEEASPGEMVTRDGRVVGRHRGLPYYTVGQRKGLGLGGGGAPWYVAALDAARNRVVVGRREELFARRLVAERVNWVGVAGRDGEVLRGEAQIRQQHRAAGGRVEVGGGGERVVVEFDVEQWGVAPGQAVVVYAGEVVLAGGVIVGGGG